MTTVLGIVGAAVLFAAFGLMRRGREPEGCQGCAGCASDDCHLHPSDSRPSDAHS